MRNHHDKRCIPELMKRQEALEDMIWAAAYAAAYNHQAQQRQREGRGCVGPWSTDPADRSTFEGFCEDAGQIADDALQGYCDACRQGVE